MNTGNDRRTGKHFNFGQNGAFTKNSRVLWKNLLRVAEKIETIIKHFIVSIYAEQINITYRRLQKQRFEKNAFEGLKAD